MVLNKSRIMFLQHWSLHHTECFYFVILLRQTLQHYSES